MKTHIVYSASTRVIRELPEVTSLLMPYGGVSLSTASKRPEVLPDDADVLVVIPDSMQSSTNGWLWYLFGRQTATDGVVIAYDPYWTSFMTPLPGATVYATNLVGLREVVRLLAEVYKTSSTEKREMMMAQLIAAYGVKNGD